MKLNTKGFKGLFPSARASLLSVLDFWYPYPITLVFWSFGSQTREELTRGYSTVNSWLNTTITTTTFNINMAPGFSVMVPQKRNGRTKHSPNLARRKDKAEIRRESRQ